MCPGLCWSAGGGLSAARPALPRPSTAAVIVMESRRLEQKIGWFMAVSRLRARGSDAPDEDIAKSDVRPMRPSPEYENEIARWRDGRARRLRSPGGWLTLVDRQVLGEGPNDVAFGTITIRDGQARVRVRPGAAVSVEGRALGDADPERVLRTDEDTPAETL